MIDKDGSRPLLETVAALGELVAFIAGVIVILAGMTKDSTAMVLAGIAFVAVAESSRWKDIISRR